MKGKYKKKKKFRSTGDVIDPPIFQQRGANFDVQMMHPNVKTVGRIYETADYDLFKLMDENRDVHISSKLRHLIETQGQLTPIVVDANFNVYDGQHRLAILKELGRPVIFVVNTEAKSYDMIAMNAAQKNWSDMDYVRYYVAQGYSEYETLLNVYESYKDFISLKSIISYLSGRSAQSSTGASEFLKYGTYKVRDYDDVIGFLNYLRLFKESTNMPNLRTTITDALYKMYFKPTFDSKRMIQKFIEKDMPNQPYHFTSRETSLDKMVTIYNDRLKEGHSKYLDYTYNKNKKLVLL